MPNEKKNHRKKVLVVNSYIYIYQLSQVVKVS